jgi:hypothetical protein
MQRLTGERKKEREMAIYLIESALDDVFPVLLGEALLEEAGAGQLEIAVVGHAVVDEDVQSAVVAQDVAQGGGE